MTYTEENELIFSDEVFMQWSRAGQSHLQVYNHLQVYRVPFKFTPQQVTSGGQEQYYFQMKCISSSLLFMKWSRAGHLQMMCTGAESPSSLPPSSNQP